MSRVIYDSFPLKLGTRSRAKHRFSQGCLHEFKMHLKCFKANIHSHMIETVTCMGCTVIEETLSNSKGYLDRFQVPRSSLHCTYSSTSSSLSLLIVSHRLFLSATQGRSSSQGPLLLSTCVRSSQPGLPLDQGQFHSCWVSL